VLSQLTIRNFAIVDRLQIDWQPGLNVITGETGAGKSILIDAVGALLGDRLGPEVVRGGAQRATIEGVFIVSDALAAHLAAVLDEYGLEPEDGALIVSREVAGGGGRGGARINGRAVPLAVLQELGERLVDVHGQSEHMALLRPREQLDYLDRFAGALAERLEVGRLVRELRATEAAHGKLLADERETARLQDRLRHEIAEIDAANLRVDEEQELLAQRARLQNVERLRQSALTAYQALTGEEDDRAGAVDLLGHAVAACLDGGKLDPALGAESEALNTALIQAEESARALRDYLEAIEADPDALERTAERLFLIGDLKRKFGDSVAEVLAYADDARGRLGEIEHRSERCEELQEHARRLHAELTVAADALSSRRRTAARQLSAAVERELADLRLAEARFGVSVERAPEMDLTGADRVEFLLAAGPDEAPRPMARVASGGELARIALALKTVLSRAETRPTLIFDEIDVGVGGRTAPVVGEKLWAVAGGGHQVLCVTHLPHVAAFADCHYAVSRSTGEVSAKLLDPDQRLDELAAMLGGRVTDAARSSARELLDRAAAVKTRQLPTKNPSRSVPRGRGWRDAGSSGR
jgi:DNA repair protein RecN (Recombination protein N)